MTDNIQHQGPDQCYPSNSFIAWLPDQAVKLRADDEDIVSNPPVSVVTAFTEVAGKYPDRIALVDLNDRVENVYTYKRYYESVTHLAKAFIKLGLETSHGVGIIGFNAPQWFISYFGTIFAGGITTGIYHLMSDNNIRYIAESTKCNIMVVEDDKLLERILEIADDLPHLKSIIQYKGQPKDGLRKVFSWTEIMEMNVADCEQEFKRRIRNMAPNKCCSVVTTSGTTGEPKLVMRSHDNILVQIKSLLNRVKEGQTLTPDAVVAYLPLCHVAGLMMDIYWPLISGGGCSHLAGLCAFKGTLINSLREIRPSVFLGLPGVWEMLMDAAIAMDGPGKQNHEEGPLNGMEKDGVDIRTKLGLNKCRLALVGGAPCSKEVFDFFSSCGITLLENYGLSETSGPHTSNSLLNFKEYTVGTTLPGFRTKCQEDNKGRKELLLDGRNIFMGYLNDEKKTREVFDDAFWLRTGDIGSQDDDGFITITGRIKELIIASHGENVAPFPIENRVLQALPCLSHCMLVGENKRLLSMLLTFKSEVDPSDGRPKDELEDSALEWCRGLGSKATKVSEILASQNPLIMDAIQKGIDKANEKAYSKTHCIQKWMILPRDFSVIGGELGPTMKLRRNKISELYQTEINGLF